MPSRTDEDRDEINRRFKSILEGISYDTLLMLEEVIDERQRNEEPPEHLVHLNEDLNYHQKRKRNN